MGSINTCILTLQWRYYAHDGVSNLKPHCNLTLQWRHYAHDGVSNLKPNHCLLNRLFSHRSKKTSKLRVIGLWEFAGDRWIPRTNGQYRVKCFHRWRHHAACNLVFNITVPLYFGLSLHLFSQRKFGNVFWHVSWWLKCLYHCRFFTKDIPEMDFDETLCMSIVGSLT